MKVQHYTQWSLKFRGELMLELIFSAAHEVDEYIARSPHPDTDYEVMSREIVHVQGEWE